MPAAVSCPPVSRLRDLMLGFVSGDDYSSLEQHILTCAACTAAIEDLGESDGLADAMRQAGSARVPRGQAVERAIERACQLGGEVEKSGCRDTSEAADETAGKKQATRPELARLVAQVLSPAKAANELGWLGPYRVLQVLGYGGMGLLFLAEDRQLQRRVALKVMQPGLAASPEAHKRFLREGRAVAALKHDNVVTVYHVGEDRGVFWLAMELLEGEPLDRCLKQKGRLEIAEAARVGREVAEALAAAHARGLIHRDIKPGNIFLETPKRRVKVLDFGLARAAQDEVELTGTGDILGTPAYMSPEQARGEAADHRSDLFSLGCVLYRMLSGKAAFGDKDTMATLMALATKNPEPVRSFVPELPEAMDELITGLLAKDPAQRPQTAAEVARKLADIETELTGGVPPAPPLVRETPFPALQTTGRLKRSRFGRNWRTTMLIAAAVIVAGLALAGVLVKVMTPAGTIVVEVDQPELVGAEVSIDGKQRLTIRSAESKEPIRVVADEKEHTLKVTKGDFETYTRRFTVKAGKSETIRVRLEKSPAKTESAVGQVDAKTAKKEASGAGAAAPASSARPAVAAADGPTALDFSRRVKGMPAYVDTGALVVTGEPLTVEMYVTPRTIVRGQVPLFKTDGKFVLNLRQLVDAWNWSWWDFTANRGYEINTPDVVLGKRTYLAAVSTGFELRLFVEGRLRGKQRIEADIKKETVLTRFGAPWADYQPFDGTIDDARISKIARYFSDFEPPRTLEADTDTIALYHFDEGQGTILVDSSGHRLHGKIFGARWVGKNAVPSPEPEPSTAMVAPPRAQNTIGEGHALEFNGQDSFVNLPVVYDGSHPLTLEMTVMPYQAENRAIVLSNNESKLGILLCSPTGCTAASRGPDRTTVLRVFLDGPAINAGLAAVPPFQPNRPMHVAGILDGTTAKVFIDGKLIQAVSLPKAHPGVDAPFVIGANPAANATRAWYFGIVDELRMSKVARYTANFTPAKRFEPDKDTLALYHFDEGRGDVVTDASGHGHSGKLVNAKWVPGLAGAALGRQPGDVKQVDQAPLQTKGGTGSAAEKASGLLQTDDRWEPLFNGKDLTGWEVTRGDTSRWEVDRGAIVGQGGQKWTDGTYILTEREYSDFALRLEFSVTNNANGSIIIRGIPGETILQWNGNSGQLHPQFKLIDVALGPERTGMLLYATLTKRQFPEQQAKMLPVGSWNRLEMEVRGPDLRATVNDGPALHATVPPNAVWPDGGVPGLARPKGRLGFEALFGTIRFRNVEIKELPKDVAAGSKGSESSSRSATNDSATASGSQPATGTAPRADSKLTFTGHEGKVSAVLLVPQRNLLLTGGNSMFKVRGAKSLVNHKGTDNTVRFWDLQTGAPGPIIKDGLGRGPTSWQIQGLALSPDGNQVAAASCRPSADFCEATVTVWKLDNQERQHHFPLPGRPGVKTPWFDVDGRTLYAIRHDTTLHKLDLTTGQEVSAAKLDPLAAEGALTSVCVSADRNLVFGGMNSGVIEVWSVSDGKKIKELRGHSAAVRSVCVSSDGKFLASASDDRTARIWDLALDQWVRQCDHEANVTAVEFAGSNQRIVTGDAAGGASLWDVGNGSRLKRLEGHTDEILCLSVSRDGRLVAAGSADKTARTWVLP